MTDAPILSGLRSQLSRAATEHVVGDSRQRWGRASFRAGYPGRRRVVASVGIVLGLGGIATGVAAAAGVFDQGATTALQRMVQSVNGSELRQFHDPSLAGGTIDPTKETVEGTEPGPEGTTLTIVTYLADARFGCVAVVDSAGPGRRLDPSKPPTGGSIGNCGTKDYNLGYLPTPAVAPDHGNYISSGSIWISPTSGQSYWVFVGRVIPQAVRVEFRYADGTEVSARVYKGWWAGSVSTKTVSNLIDAPATAYTETIYDASGNVLDRSSMSS